MLENVIMTDMRVNTSTNTVEMFFKDIGTLHVRKSLHKFPSISFTSDNKRNEVIQEIKKDPILSQHKIFIGCEEKRYDGKAVFNIIHYKAPITVQPLLKRKFDKKFISGHYIEEERLSIGAPHAFYKVDKNAYKAGFIARKYNQHMAELRTNLENYFSKDNLSKATITRRFNELNKPFLEKGEINEDENKKLTQKIAENFIEQREDIEKYKKEIHELKGVSTFFYQDNLEVLVDRDMISFQKSLSYKDILDTSWVLFDIEVPRFKTSNEISWVGITYFSSSEIINEIHTLSPVSIDKFKEYNVFIYDNEKELIRNLRNKIKSYEPFVVSAFNNPFDFRKLRDVGEFDIGEEDSDPKTKVSTKFFERIGVKGYLCVDLLRISQSLFDFLPNKKLELISSIVLRNDSLDKIINYDEMAHLEHVARNIDSNNHLPFVKHFIEEYSEKKVSDLSPKEIQVISADIIATYLTGDIDTPRKIIQSSLIKDFFSAVTTVSNISQVPVEMLLYSLRSIKNINKRDYFQRYGTHKENLFFNTSSQRERISSDKQFFRDLFTQWGDFKVPSGVYENVHLVHLKIGHHFKELLGNVYPHSKELFELKPNNTVSNYVLGQISNNLAEWFIIDYAWIKSEQKRLEKLSKQHNLSYEKIEKLYNKLTYNMKTAAKSTKNELTSGTLKESTFARFMPEQYKARLEQIIIESDKDKEEVIIETLSPIVSLLNKYRRIQNRSFRFKNEYKIDDYKPITLVDYQMNKLLDNARYFAENNNLTILHQEGPYMYVQGDISTLNRKSQYAVIHSFDKVLITHEYKKSSLNNLGSQKLYYKISKFYKGTKIVDHPTHFLNIIDMRMQKSFIDNMLANNPEKALQGIFEVVNYIQNKEAKNSELVEFSKNSEQYKAYEDGKTIYFTSNVPFEENDIKKFPDDPRKWKQRETFFDQDMERVYINKTIQNKQKKIFIIDVDDFTPDWIMYENRLKKKVFDIAYSFFGPALENLFE